MPLLPSTPVRRACDYQDCQSIHITSFFSSVIIVPVEMMSSIHNQQRALQSNCQAEFSASHLQQETSRVLKPARSSDNVDFFLGMVGHFAGTRLPPTLSVITSGVVAQRQMNDPPLVGWHRFERQRASLLRSLALPVVAPSVSIVLRVGSLWQISTSTMMLATVMFGQLVDDQAQDMLQHRQRLAAPTN